MLWLWHRLAAVAAIRPLAWEIPYAMGLALKKKKKEHFEVELREFGRMTKVSNLGNGVSNTSIYGREGVSTMNLDEI